MRAKASTLAEYPIPIAPLPEQHRIVAKIEELFSELDKGVESLKKAREQLKVYRQAVLKHAFEGKLTAQWREENKDKLETPEQLLARIKQEREARYAQQIEEWRAAVRAWEKSGESGKKPPRPRKLTEVSSVSDDETKSLPALVNGWSYLRLGLVIDEPKYGTSKKCDYDYQGTGVLRIPNVIDGVIDVSDLKGAPFEDFEKRTYALKSGDILMIRSNGSISIVGKCAVISEQEEKYLFAGYLICLRGNPTVISPDYLAALLSSRFVRNQIEYKAKSTSGVNNVNSHEVRSLIVPLCSPPEQEVVVEQLSKCLSTTDFIETLIEDELHRANVLRQSILKRAFSGQLVPQDPNDEPSSKLLERIKADKANDKSSQKRPTTQDVRMTSRLSVAVKSLLRQRAAERERAGYPVVQINIVWSAPGADGERVQENEFKGLLPIVIYDAINHIERSYLTQTVIKTGGRPRVKRFWNFPIEAISEALINAIFHRSYEEQTPVEVRVARREVSVLSFPGPDRSIRMADLQAGRAVGHPCRNRRIGEILRELDVAEGRSTGIPRMLEAMRKNGSPVPIFKSDEGRTWFRVRLPAHEQVCPAPAELEPMEIST